MSTIEEKSSPPSTPIPARRSGRGFFGACPMPRSQYDHIVLGHGSGGWLTADLIQRLFVPGFGSDVLARLEDQATVRLGGDDGVKSPRVAFTTDSFVVRPLFFPGATSAGWRSAAR